MQFSKLPLSNPNPPPSPGPGQDRAREPDGRWKTALTDDEIAVAVRPLYRSDDAAEMALTDDLNTAYAVLQALPTRVQVGWLVALNNGTRFWPVDERAEAVTCCAAGTEPVEIWADSLVLQNHQAVNAD